LAGLTVEVVVLISDFPPISVGGLSQVADVIVTTGAGFTELVGIGN
jgi:hypothetical protein